MMLYIGHSSFGETDKGRDAARSADVTGCVTTQIRNAVGSATKKESTIMLGVVEMAAKASTPSRSGMAFVSLFSVAAESFGHEHLSCSAARTPASISTLSMLLSSAAARRVTLASILRPPSTHNFWEDVIRDTTDRRVAQKEDAAWCLSRWPGATTDARRPSPCRTSCHIISCPLRSSRLRLFCCSAWSI